MTWRAIPMGRREYRIRLEMIDGAAHEFRLGSKEGSRAVARFLADAMGPLGIQAVVWGDDPKGWGPQAAPEKQGAGASPL